MLWTKEVGWGPISPLRGSSAALLCCCMIPVLHGSLLHRAAAAWLCCCAMSQILTSSAARFLRCAALLLIGSPAAKLPGCAPMLPDSAGVQLRGSTIPQLRNLFVPRFCCWTSVPLHEAATVLPRCCPGLVPPNVAVATSFTLGSANSSCPRFGTFVGLGSCMLLLGYRAVSFLVTLPSGVSWLRVGDGTVESVSSAPVFTLGWSTESGMNPW